MVMEDQLTISKILKKVDNKLIGRLLNSSKSLWDNTIEQSQSLSINFITKLHNVSPCVDLSMINRLVSICAFQKGPYPAFLVRLLSPFNCCLSDSSHLVSLKSLISLLSVLAFTFYRIKFKNEKFLKEIYVYLKKGCNSLDFNELVLLYFKIIEKLRENIQLKGNRISDIYTKQEFEMVQFFEELKHELPSQIYWKSLKNSLIANHQNDCLFLMDLVSKRKLTFSSFETLLLFLRRNVSNSIITQRMTRLFGLGSSQFYLKKAIQEKKVLNFFLRKNKINDCNVFLISQIVSLCNYRKSERETHLIFRSFIQKEILEILKRCARDQSNLKTSNLIGQFGNQENQCYFCDWKHLNELINSIKTIPDSNITNIITNLLFVFIETNKTKKNTSNMNSVITWLCLTKNQFKYQSILFYSITQTSFGYHRTNFSKVNTLLALYERKELKENTELLLQLIMFYSTFHPKRTNPYVDLLELCQLSSETIECLISELVRSHCILPAKQVILKLGLYPKTYSSCFEKYSQVLIQKAFSSGKVSIKIITELIDFYVLMEKLNVNQGIIELCQLILKYSPKYLLPVCRLLSFRKTNDFVDPKYLHIAFLKNDLSFILKVIENCDEVAIHHYERIQNFCIQRTNEQSLTINSVNQSDMFRSICRRLAILGNVHSSLNCSDKLIKLSLETYKTDSLTETIFDFLNVLKRPLTLDLCETLLNELVFVLGSEGTPLALTSMLKNPNISILNLLNQFWEKCYEKKDLIGLFSTLYCLNTLHQQSLTTTNPESPHCWINRQEELFFLMKELKIKKKRTVACLLNFYSLYILENAISRLLKEKCFKFHAIEEYLSSNFQIEVHNESFII